MRLTMLVCVLCSRECPKGCARRVAERDFSKECFCRTSSMHQHCEKMHPGLSREKVRNMDNFTSVPVVVRAFDPWTYPLIRDDSADPEPAKVVRWPDVYHTKTVHMSEPVASIDLTRRVVV